jgi:hypothetical protein
MVSLCREQIRLPSGKLQSHSLSPTQDAPALSNRTCHVYVNRETKSENVQNLSMLDPNSTKGVGKQSEQLTSVCQVSQIMGQAAPSPRNCFLTVEACSVTGGAKPRTSYKL